MSDVFEDSRLRRATEVSSLLGKLSISCRVLLPYAYEVSPRGLNPKDDNISPLNGSKRWPSEMLVEGA